MMKVMLWAILLGSVIMGFIGYQSGSATNAAVGIGVVILTGLALLLVLKIMAHVGFFIGKVLLFFALAGLIILSCVKGYQYLTGKGHSVEREQPSETDTFNNDVADKTIWRKMSSFFEMAKSSPVTGRSRQQQPVALQKKEATMKLPDTIGGRISEIRSGYLFKIGKHYVKLYGIDTPDPRQKCLNNRGENFDCGHVSKLMLERLSLGRETKCHVLGGDYNGNYIATCQIQGFDIGGSMVLAGWAVADREVSSVYIPLEEKAHQAREGLWAGKFVAPWQDRASRAKRKIRLRQKEPEKFWEKWLS